MRKLLKLAAFAVLSLGAIVFFIQEEERQAVENAWNVEGNGPYPGGL